MNEYLGPKHPVWNRSFIAIASPITVVVLGALWFLWQKCLAVYVGLNPDSDAVRINLLGAVGLAGLLGLAIGVASVVGHVIHRRAVHAWLASRVSPGARKYFADCFGEEMNDYCWNPLAPCNFVLAIEYFACVGLILATNGAKKILRRFLVSLDDTKPNLVSYPSHSTDSQRVLLALQTAMRSQVLRSQAKSLPGWGSDDGDRPTFPHLAEIAERIMRDYRLNVYDLLHREPPTDAAAADLIYEAKGKLNEIFDQLDSHKSDLERLQNIVVSQFWNNRVIAFANRRPCRPPGKGKYAILETTCIGNRLQLTRK